MRTSTSAQLGELIRERRHEAGLTQKQLAALAGVSPRLVLELEHGREGVGVALVLRVLATLGLDVHVVRRGDPVPGASS